jgi:hypothetical protein
MDDEDDGSLNLTRAPTDEDLARLAAKLNQLGAKYIVVGGLAIIAAGYTRATMDVDLLVDTSPENDKKSPGSIGIATREGHFGIGSGRNRKLCGGSGLR